MESKLLIVSTIIGSLLLIYLVNYFRRIRTLREVFSNKSFLRINRKNVQFKRILKYLLLLMAIPVLILSLFIPVIDSEEKLKDLFNNNKIETKKRVVFVLDVSLSMITDDVNPSRLERAKLTISEIMKKMPDTSFALIPFAGSAFIQSPFTTDIEMIERFLEIIDQSTVKSGGSSLTTALSQVERMLEKEKKSTNPLNKVETSLIVFTDGADFSDEEESIYEEIQDLKLKVYIFGVGGDKPVPITLLKMPNRSMDTYKLDKSMKVVKTRLEKENLTKIAGTMGGKFVKAVDEIIDPKKQVFKVESKINDNAIPDKYFLFYIILPLIILFLELIIPLGTIRKSKWLGRFES